MSWFDWFLLVSVFIFTIWLFFIIFKVNKILDEESRKDKKADRKM